MIEFWSDYHDLFTLLFASATLLVANINFKKFADAEAVKALSDLRSKLNREGLVKVHKYFMREKDDNNEQVESSNRDLIIPDKAELMDYFGTIELGAIMLQKGLISKSEFYNQFGYRVENIMRSDLVGQEIFNELDYYKYMIYAFKIIEDIRPNSSNR